MQLLVFIIFTVNTLFSHHAYSVEQPLLIVTDSWPPYVIDEGAKLFGTDVDITRHVFKEMGLAIDIKVVPWKRSVALIKHKKADGILAVSLTSAREEFIYYPEVPVSEGVTVLFAHKDRLFNFNKLADLNSKRTGAMLGYNYCAELDNAAFVKQAERVATLEQNFKKLMANRLDIFLEVDSVGLYTAKKMSLDDKIAIIPNASFCKGGNYLGFSKKPGHQQLADAFSQALSKFKNTQEYALILQKYGL